MISDDYVPQRAPQLAEIASEGRTVVLDLSRPDHAPFILAGAAHAIWTCVDGKRSVEQIRTQTRFLDQQVICEFLESLMANGLTSSAGQ